MAIPGSKARSIGKEAAEKVIHQPGACRCGAALWSVRSLLTAFDYAINYKQPMAIQAMPTHRPLSEDMTDNLKFVEKDCGADMAKAKGLVKQLGGAIIDRNWDKAREDYHSLFNSIIDPIKKGAVAEEAGEMKESIEKRAEGSPKKEG